MRKSAGMGVIAVALMGLTACSSDRTATSRSGGGGSSGAGGAQTCCTEEHVKYALSGDPITPPAGCASIVIAYYQNTDSACVGDKACSVTARIPGSEVMEQAVEASAPYSAMVPVSYVGGMDPPLLDVQAYCDANANAKIDSGEVCFAFTELLAGDGDEVALTYGACPGRE